MRLRTELHQWQMVVRRLEWTIFRERKGCLNRYKAEIACNELVQQTGVLETIGGFSLMSLLVLSWSLQGLSRDVSPNSY